MQQWLLEGGQTSFSPICVVQLSSTMSWGVALVQSSLRLHFFPLLPLPPPAFPSLTPPAGASSFVFSSFSFPKPAIKSSKLSCPVPWPSAPAFSTSYEQIEVSETNLNSTQGYNERNIPPDLFHLYPHQHQSRGQIAAEISLVCPLHPPRHSITSGYLDSRAQSSSCPLLSDIQAGAMLCGGEKCCRRKG